MPAMIEKVVRLLQRLEDSILVMIVLLMVIIAFGQIVMRNFFGMGSIWIDPLLRIMVLWVGLLGALVATRMDKQISVDVLTRLLPPRLTQLSHIITRLFAAIVSGIIAWHSSRFVLDEWHMDTMAFASVPAWLPVSIIPVGFGIISLRYLLQALTARPTTMQAATQPQ